MMVQYIQENKQAKGIHKSVILVKL